LDRPLDGKIDRRCSQLEAKFEAKFQLLSWMVGFNLLLTAGVLWTVLTAQLQAIFEPGARHPIRRMVSLRSKPMTCSGKGGIQ
jgi:hypothetical protein